MILRAKAHFAVLAAPSGCAPPGALLLLACPRRSKQEEGHPNIRPRRSRGRMRGVLSLWLLSLCTGRRSASKEKVTRPSGAKP
ncbi:hypothetical protein PSNTI_42340 [Stutzerimonas stutzeri]|nr:hypothetical protein PSNTI_42340 [Stutzerimonas stutzeri]